MLGAGLNQLAQRERSGDKSLFLTAIVMLGAGLD
jgi:hypothetical protein